MTPQYDERGRYSKLSGEKGEMPQTSGEFTAKPANLAEDARKMQKIIDKEDVEYVDDEMQRAKQDLLDFANHSSEDYLFDFFYSLSNVKDMNKIDSLIASLPPQPLSSIGTQHIEMIRDELYRRLSESKSNDEVSVINNHLSVLNKLEQAIGKLQ